MSNKNILLVNPWIADFAAYDLWAKPLGLLYIGAFLRKYGYDISLLDFLDRKKWSSNPKGGKGKYNRTQIEKPSILKNIERNFAIYGATDLQIKTQLQLMEPPSIILITSHMNYWYVGVQKSIELLRKYFPKTPILFGGIYATLYEEHAHQNIDADYFIKGYGEKKSLMILDALYGISRNYKEIPEFDDSLFPPYDLYDNLDSLPLNTSRGCPMNCSFCATKILNSDFHRRSVENLIAEVKHNYEKYCVTNYAFYDDALFVNKEKYIVPFLEKIIELPQKFEFYSPNGLFAKPIDEKLAELMFEAGFKMVRLGLESTVSKWQKASSNKVSKDDFARAVKNLRKAGFRNRDIEAYLIMGLPEETFEDVKESLEFVYENSAISRLTSYTPIPRTIDWSRAVQLGLIEENCDPLLTNNSIYPCASKILTIEQFQELKHIMNKFNEEVRNQEE